MEARVTQDQPDIRPLTLNDDSALYVLHGESFGAARWSIEQVRSSLALETTFGRISYKNGSPCGFILCQLAGDEAEILTFCVSPSVRRVKIGLSLLTHALADGRAKNARCFFLEVAADNTAALRLYKKSGFREVGLRPGYYARKTGAVDAVLMALDL